GTPSSSSSTTSMWSSRPITLLISGRKAARAAAELSRPARRRRLRTTSTRPPAVFWRDYWGNRDVRFVQRQADYIVVRLPQLRRRSLWCPRHSAETLLRERAVPISSKYLTLIALTRHHGSDSAGHCPCSDRLCSSPACLRG